MFPRILYAAAAAALSACATAPEPASAPVEAFSLTEDLAGRHIARGAFDPLLFGDTRRFTATLNGYMDGEVFVLEEDFEYEDGETDRKVWRLTPTGPGRWRGARGDVVGTAEAWRDGEAFRMSYLVKLDGRTVRFRDLLYKTGPETIENKARVTWRGLPVGSVDLTMTPN